MKLAGALVLVLLAAPCGAAGAAKSAVVFPSGPSIPENLLRIEIDFGAPLGHILDVERIKLLDGAGSEIGEAFLDLPLPDREMRRFTLLLHPGRVKSGVGANLALGRALRAGEKVTLVITDPALTQPLRKTWQVEAFDADSPRPQRWIFTAPAYYSRDPLVVRFDGALSSTARSLIAIRGPDGERIPGAAHLEAGETAWRFVPAQPWRAGAYALVTHPQLEDPAGNRPCAPFELARGSRVRCEEESVMPFVVR